MLLLVSGIAAALASIALIAFGLWNVANNDVQDRNDVYGGTVEEEASLNEGGCLNQSLLTP
jgi:hypothetical protein